MSKNTNEETISQATVDTETKSATARKTTAKKAATKKVAAKKTTAKKAAVKKVAAKKTATKKTAVDQVELPLDVASAPVKPAAAKKTASPRARKAAAVATEESPVSAPAPAAKEETRPAEASQSAPAADSQVEESPRRFGRVPGGGPVGTATQKEPSSNDSHESGVQNRDTADLPPKERHSHSRDGQHAAAGNHAEGGNGGDSRSKRRREKRKRRRDQERKNRNDRGERNPRGGEDFQQERRPVQLDGPKVEVDGMLELAPKGFGFLRVPGKNFEQARDDVFVPPDFIRKYNLRLGQWIHGISQEGPRGPQLVEITSINGMTIAEAAKLPHFDELKAINPNKRISFETTSDRFTTRVVDLMAPVGRGQRGLIVSPPRSGKTTLLLHMAEAIREKYDEQMHLMIILVDERPEEVTEFRRALPGAEIFASSNDEGARSHCRIAELAIERAKRLVEAGQDVFVLMDSITRLARAYNGNMNHRGRGTGTGGLTIGSLEVPRRLFAAARNTRGGGSLTILATALIQTNSRADEAIYMEFKGTGNMELVLDRKIAENYIYPAVDIFKSGTRREELLLPDHMLHKIHLIRRGLAGHRPAEAMERLLYFLKKFPNNPQMLLEIKG
ncbi:transcription termination factor Rho [Luteolibacter pohnpeiensis]|uniref:Transcription termination factor Rho n=1 Tax=Luteolibacter pohnpeiensis TaxID=454153 RepID=A0A934VV20_9BACT|nr:transcription termination factor Rho [Luteolibacter pohnpeiensis]MBK1881089.1 transcription termination factor Rho [Luteolibacter pohnpeiensis]